MRGIVDNEVAGLTRLGQAISEIPCLQVAVISFSASLIALNLVKSIVTVKPMLRVLVLFEDQESLDRMLRATSGEPWARNIRCSLRQVADFLQYDSAGLMRIS